MNVKEYDEGAGATTITFQDVAVAQGFQIYIVPYKEAQVSEERFKQDSPLGVRDSLRTTSVDGAVGATFYGKDSFLGETYEAWFVRDGYLYEVTTLKALEAMLTTVLSTWEFI